MSGSTTPASVLSRFGEFAISLLVSAIALHIAFDLLRSLFVPFMILLFMVLVVRLAWNWRTAKQDEW